MSSCETHEINNCSRYKTTEQPHENHFLIENQVFLPDIVQMMVIFLQIIEIRDSRSKFSIVNILVKNRSYDNWQTSEGKVIESDVKIIKESLTTPSIVETEEKLREGENDIFIVKIENHFGIPDIGPTSMYEKQFPKTLKFSQSEIRGLHSSHSFLSIQTNSDMSFLNHVAIISPISNR